eukprot:543017_1
MTNALAKIKKSYNDLDENDKIVRRNLQQICGSLKQQIDKKQNQMILYLDSIYQHRLNELNQRHEITQQSAQTVIQFYKNYEGYFVDNTLSKKDRKNKLIAAQNCIGIEIGRVNKYHRNYAMNMNIEMNQKAVKRFLNQCLDLRNVEINLRPVTVCKVYGTVIKWKSPQINDDILSLFGKQSQRVIVYSILYRDTTHD